MTGRQRASQARAGAVRRRQRRGATGRGDSSRRSRGWSRMPPPPPPLPPPARLVFPHGASGTAASLRPHVEGLRARGVDAHAIDIPRRRAEDAVPAYLAAVAALPTTVPGTRLVIGGHSYGGRVASLLAADGRLSDLAGLVCLSYPLHRPGAPDDGLRTEHWPRIAVPTLILEGEADPFARIDLLRAAMPLLPRGHLVTFPRLAHGLLPVLDEALDALVEWLGGGPGDTRGGRGGGRG